MDKRELRRIIGEKKRALSAREIEARSAALAEKLFQTDVYQISSLEMKRRSCFLRYRQCHASPRDADSMLISTLPLS